MAISDAQRYAQQQARLLYLKKHRPNDPEIKVLQQKIAAYVPPTGGGVDVVNNPAPPADSTPPPVDSTPPPVDDKKITDSITIDPNTGLTPEDQSALTRAKEILSIGEDFGTAIMEKFYKDGSLGRIDETLTPEELQAQTLAKEFALKQSGLTDTSALENEALDLARQQLLGLSAPQMEALRSQARGNIQGGIQAQARQLAKAQSSGQVFGAARTAQNRLLGQSGVRSVRELERDLLIKDIEIKQAAANQFQNLVTQTEANKTGRSRTALDANQQYTNVAGQLADKVRSLKEFNINQVAAEKAGQMGSFFGGIGAISDQRGLLAGEEFAKKAAEAAAASQQKILDMINASLKKQNQTAGV